MIPILYFVAARLVYRFLLFWVVMHVYVSIFSALSVDFELLLSVRRVPNFLGMNAWRRMKQALGLEELVVKDYAMCNLIWSYRSSYREYI